MFQNQLNLILQSSKTKLQGQQQLIIMNSQAIMMRQLQKNENSQILKQAINKAANTVEQRVYWLNTSEMEGDFLQQYWEKQVTANDVMKKRIAKITQQKFDELFAEIDKKKMSSANQLQVFHIGNLNLSSLAQDIPIFDHNYFSQNHPKTMETKAKLKQIHEDYNRFKERIQEMKRRQQQKKLEKQVQEEQMRKSLEKEKKERLRQQVMKTIQEKNHKKQERKVQIEKYKQFLKVYKSSKPLHVLMEQEYKQKIELPMLEQNKKKLQEYKQKVKPTLEEINEHQRNYLDSISNRQSRIVVANQTIDVFKSKFYLEEQKKLLQADDAYQTLFDQAEKKKRYSQLVKQNFKPKISMKLRQSINQSQMKVSTAREGLDRTAQFNKGKDYLQFMRSLEKKRKQHSSPSQRAQQQPVHRYANYLQTLKQSRQVQGNQSKMSHDWQRDIKNKSLSEYQRRQRILMKSRQLQQLAQRKQQFVNNNHYGKAEEIIEKKKQIDQTLISSIRAKVAVLKDAHQL